MIDFSTHVGARAAQRLADEFVVWLTTVSPAGIPQPRPVWFIWDGQAVLIYSEPTAKKLTHIAQNPHVALHFDGGPKGLDYQVFLGIAELVADPTPAHQAPGYMQKYGQEIRAMGGTEEDFAALFSVAVRVLPTRLRGFGTALPMEA